MSQCVEVELKKSEILKNICNQFQSSISVKSASLPVIKKPLIATSILIFQTLSKNRKVMIFGDTESLTNCHNLATKLKRKFSKENVQLIKSHKEIEKINRTEDILVIIDTSGNTDEIMQLTQAAKKNNISIIIICGNDGEKTSEIIDSENINIQIPSTNKARIQETHYLVTNVICDAVFWQLQQTKENDIS
jgi:phosphoheptose isomerase